MKHLILVFLALVPVLPANGQFTGTILESGTNKPVADATIRIGGNVGATSWSNGHFEIRINDYPAVLSISHVSYHPAVMIIQSSVQSGITILLVPKVVEIGEVVVAGERIHRFLERQYFYVVDYDFMGDNICLIGYENGNLARGRILLLNHQDDTLAFEKVRNPRKIYRDACDNLHLVTRDSICQIFYQDNRLHLLYPTHQKEVPQEFFQLKFIEGSRFLFRIISDRDRTHEYVVIDTLNKTQATLKKIETIGLKKSGAPNPSYGRWEKAIPGRAEARDMSAGAMEAYRDMFEMYAFNMSIVYFPVHSQMFARDGGYLLTDLTNSLIYQYDNNFGLIKTVKADLPKHPQRQKEVIQDPFTQKIYWVYYEGSRVLLGEIDPETGRIVNTLQTPSLPFIENIKIRNGVIWFTYQPRLGETVRSLYRMN